MLRRQETARAPAAWRGLEGLRRAPMKPCDPATPRITPPFSPGPLCRRAPEDPVWQPGGRPAQRHQGSQRGVPMQRHRMAGRPDLLHRGLCGRRRRLRCARGGRGRAGARAFDWLAGSLAKSWRKSACTCPFLSPPTTLRGAPSSAADLCRAYSRSCPSTACQANRICDPASGTCSVPTPLANGTLCANGSCLAGVCTCEGWVCKRWAFPAGHGCRAVLRENPRPGGHSLAASPRTPLPIDRALVRPPSLLPANPACPPAQQTSAPLAT
jgi:hypothetical protein